MVGLLIALAACKAPEANDIITTQDELGQAVINPTYDKSQIATLDPTPQTAFTHGDLLTIGADPEKAKKLLDLYNALKSNDGSNNGVIVYTPVATKISDYIPKELQSQIVQYENTDVEWDCYDCLP